MIDTNRYDELTGGKHTTLHEWNIPGHTVAWMLYEGTDIYGKRFIGRDLYCECDFLFREEEYIDLEGNTKKRPVKTQDSFNCPEKEKVRAEVKKESRNYYRNVWENLELKETVMHIFDLVDTDGKWLGQRTPGLIYVQEVAELLEREPAEIWRVCDRLFAEERLDLNGAILRPYEPRFRFPIEIQNLFKLVIEEPLGWPNGEAGDFALYDLEQAIHLNTPYRHGKDLFWEHNYPHLSRVYLFEFGLRWMHLAFKEAGCDAETQKHLNILMKELHRMWREIHSSEE